MPGEMFCLGDLFCYCTPKLFLSTQYQSCNYHIFKKMVKGWYGINIIIPINCAICFAWWMLWYIPIFRLVAQASILDDDGSKISSRFNVKYFRLSCCIIIDRREYNYVTVCAASVIFAIRVVLGLGCVCQYFSQATALVQYPWYCSILLGIHLLCVWLVSSFFIHCLIYG